MIDADMSAVLPIDYLSKTIVSIMTEDWHRVGRDYDFLNSRAPSCDEFFEMMSTAGGGKEMLTFSAWRQRALEHATAHPTSPLARITAIFGSYTDETAPDMFKNLGVGDSVFGIKDYPAPHIGEQFVGVYLSRMMQDSEASGRLKCFHWFEGLRSLVSSFHAKND